MVEPKVRLDNKPDLRRVKAIVSTFTPAAFRYKTNERVDQWYLTKPVEEAIM